MLPAPPRFTLELTRETRYGAPGFIELSRSTLVATLPSGTRSEPFVYDIAMRSKLDAVVIAAHFVQGGVRHVFLRSAIRPPVALRAEAQQPFPEAPGLGNLWELPAGLVEETERSPAGLISCARRETLEELGFDLPDAAFSGLGPSTFPAPGVIAERHFFFHAEVDPTLRRTPTEDGSVLEREAHVISIPLSVALDACRTGILEDAKTELALRRLAELPAT